MVVPSSFSGVVVVVSLSSSAVLPVLPKSKKNPVPASPATRRLAREMRVDLSMVIPTGRGEVVTSDDVKKYAEKSKNETVPVIENADIWLNVLNEKAEVVIWNNAAEKISGYSREEIVGSAVLNQVAGAIVAHVEECGVVRSARCLLHVVGDDDNSVL